MRSLANAKVLMVDPAVMAFSEGVSAVFYYIPCHRCDVQNVWKTSEERNGTKRLSEQLYYVLRMSPSNGVLHCAQSSESDVQTGE